MSVQELSQVSVTLRNRRALKAWVASLPIADALKSRLLGAPMPVLHWARRAVDEMWSTRTFRMAQPGVLDELTPNEVASLAARQCLKFVLSAQADCQPYFVDEATRRIFRALVQQWGELYDTILSEMRQDHDPRICADSEPLCCGAMDIAATVLFELLDGSAVYGVNEPTQRSS